MGEILRGSWCLGSERVKKQTILSPWEGGEGLSLSVLFGELCTVGGKELKGDQGASCLTRQPHFGVGAVGSNFYSPLGGSDFAPMVGKLG